VMKVSKLLGFANKALALSIGVIIIDDWKLALILLSILLGSFSLQIHAWTLEK